MLSPEPFVPVALFEQANDNQPKPFTLSLSRLEQRLQQFDERDTKDGKLWSPVTYRPGSTRGKAGVAEVWMLVLDVDHGNVPWDLLQGHEWFGHTTWSHTPELPRWRVVLPLRHPIAAQDWPAFWLRANSHFGGCIDPATKDASRIFYLPSHPPGAPHEARVEHGELLDPDSLPAVPQYIRPTTTRKSGTNAGLARWAQQFAEQRCYTLGLMGVDTGRNDATNRLAYLLAGLVAEGNHGLDEQAVTNLLLNASGHNGLLAHTGERAVLATISSGFEAGLLKPWSPADQEEPVTQRTNGRHNGHTATPVVAQPGEEFDAISLITEAIPEPRWAVPGIMPEGVVLLAGKSKLGKSWLGLDLALAVAEGGTAWGAIGVEQGEVFYLALEDSKRRLQDRLRTLRPDNNVPAGLTFRVTSPRADDGGIDIILDWLNRHGKARLIIIDVLGKFRPREANARRLYDLDYEAIAPIAEVARHRGVCILVICHCNKMNPEDPLDSVSGTTGLVGAADAICVFRRERGKADASLFVVGRDVEEQDLAFKNTLDQPGPHAWELMPGDAQMFRRSTQRQEVLEVLAALPGLTPAEIAGALGKTSGTIRNLLFHMVRDEEVRLREGRYYQTNANALTVPVSPITHVTTASPATGGSESVKKRECRLCGMAMHEPNYTCPTPTEKP